MVEPSQTEVHQESSDFINLTQRIKSNYPPSKGHQLTQPWCFWVFDRNRLTEPNLFNDYGAAIQKVAKVSTLEQFFNLFMYFKKPSEMPREFDCFVFRDGEKPTWENNR